MVPRSCIRILAWLGLKVRSRDSWLMFGRFFKIGGRLSSMLRLNVALPNGHAEVLTLPPSSVVQDVRMKAQQAFRKKCVRLITAKNRVLVNFAQTLEEAEIEDGECLTALVLQPQLAATGTAFALWCHGDSAIVTWGDEDRGGDSSAVRDQLKGGAPPPASCTSTCSAPPGPCADKSTGCEGEENLQGILWPPASRRARRPRALC